MIKKQTIQALCLILTLVVLLILSTWTAKTQDGDCNLDQHNKCKVSYPGTSVDPVVVYKPQKGFVLEQTSTLRVEGVKNLQSLPKAWLSGVNMVMGQIPLMVSWGEDSSVILIEVTPVMCSQPNMQWQIQVDDPSSSEQSSLKINFSTRR